MHPAPVKASAGSAKGFRMRYRSGGSWRQLYWVCGWSSFTFLEARPMVGEVGPGGVRQPGTVIKLAEAVACGRVGNL